ncbi:MAG: cytochrome ubiquinol oxidase subunit I [Actinomycetota bacterium]|nr:cytochrome ubiquinol oxidase subunit I [Actinomycetota bacterium]MDQ3721112.1 cytochrome ubiquinol oxidase subunit I [Actinomycetota bacterium]
MIDLGLLAQVTGGLGDPGPQPDLLEARQMQALSLGVHIPLVCFGISFPAMVLFLEGLWLRTGDQVYKDLAKRWSKVMLVLFAVGVVTGTVLSFEFGLLWPNFTATFGEVFGLGFMLEGFSFFIEAIFIGIYVYGWDRLKPKLHLLCAIPIVITGVTGSLTVIAVNGWMNDPTGFDVVDGKVTNVRPWEALFNDFLAHEFVHMYIAGYLVSGFIVAGVYAWAWLKGRRDRYHRIGLVVPLTIAALAAPVQIVVGDWAARTVAERQPVKLAAFEGLADNEKGAPFTIGGVYVDGELKYGLPVPKLLSFLADHQLNSEVTGLNSVPKEDQPPVNVVHISFQVMVAIGTALAGLGLLYLLTWWRRRRLPRSKWFYRAVVAAGPLAVVALIAGWITTEVGRQPWVVYEVMRTSQAVTSADGLETGYVFLVVLYTALAAGVVWLLRRLSRHPPEVGAGAPEDSG